MAIDSRLDSLPSTGRAGSGTSFMVAGMMVGVIAAYGFQLAGGRVLGTEDFAPISVLWTLQFLLVTIIFIPVEQMIIRDMTASRARGAGFSGSWPTILIALFAGALLGSAIVAATLDEFFLGSWNFVFAAFAIFLGFGLTAVGKGFLGGRQRYREYGLVVGGEALTRLAAAAAILALSPSPQALAWAMATSGVVVLATRPFRTNTAPEVEDEIKSGSSLRFLSGLFTGNAASQALLASGPLVVGALGSNTSDISVFFITFTLFRGPLTMSYTLLARVLPPLTGMTLRGEFHRLWRIARASAILGITGAVIAGFAAAGVGPLIVEVLFGAEFRPSRPLAALAAAGVIAGGVAFFMGQALVAQARTRAYAAVWVGGLLVAALAIAISSGDPTSRVAVAFAIGEGTALFGTLLALRPRFGRLP